MLVSSSKSMRLIILWFCSGTHTWLKNLHNNVCCRIHPDESAQVCTTLGRCSTHKIMKLVNKSA
jgi:hypothetical protein